NVCFCVSLVSQSGCKTTSLFLTGKTFLKFFLETFRFQFSSFLNQSLNELACFAGCKGKQRFQISQAFLNLFFILFSQTFLKN
ncbi:hypothetical protein, partial [Flavobacterium sp. FlaQc-50]|uniref:hypothetical protein n=1 Tax=unclassified Flavobacterium TaxID=196869 RepID=UPI003757048A